MASRLSLNKILVALILSSLHQRRHNFYLHCYKEREIVCFFFLTFFDCEVDCRCIFYTSAHFYISLKSFPFCPTSTECVLACFASVDSFTTNQMDRKCPFNVTYDISTAE